MMMIRKLLILLLHNQFLCYGSWALRTPTLPSSSGTSMPITVIESLPTPAAQQQSNTHHNSNSNSNNNNNKTNLISIETNCTRDLFEIHVDFHKKFHGILFAKDFVEECRTRGSNNQIAELKLPTSGCGIRSKIKPDGSLEFSVQIMLQMDEKLRQSSDVKKLVKCQISTKMMTMDLVLNNGIPKRVESKKYFRNGRMRSAVTSTKSSTAATTVGGADNNETPVIPRVRIWLELGGNHNGNDDDDSGAVEVGEATTLAVRAVLPGTIGVRVVDCAALDGLGESSQELLDFRGCPWDDQVMPALHTRVRPAEEGWSKSNEEDLVEKLYTATFPAFKFPDRERLHVSCGVQLCRGQCPNVNCRGGGEHDGKMPADKQLARIEVFNSLAVTAPQIDQLRANDVEEYPPRVRSLHSDGILCLSISNLALAFCVLGLIFVVAVVVAVCCLIRSKSRHHFHNGSVRAASTSMFSSSSDSAQSTRFGSKLLMPYQGGTLPYGRVY